MSSYAAQQAESTQPKLSENMIVQFAADTRLKRQEEAADRLTSKLSELIHPSI